MPTVSSVSGTVESGSSLVISGSSFGLGYANPLLWDDFDASSAANGATLSGPPQMGTWSPTIGAGLTHSSTETHSGVRALHAKFDSSAQWSNFVVELPAGVRFYQSFWFWWDSTANDGQLKLALVHGDSNQGEFAPTVNNNCSNTAWWLSNVATESTAGMSGGTWPNNPGPKQWHHFEMAMHQSSGGGAEDGAITVWVDGQENYSRTNIVTRDDAQYRWNEMGFFHGVTNMSAPTDTYLDDVYAAASWARVVLCDSPTYATCTHTEVQPATSWSDGSITIQLSLGAFPDLSKVYLYVIDENGVVNETGFPL